jgi:hypothetical protein
MAPMKIAVAGATGRVGRHLVDVLDAEGHDVVAMSRSSGVDVVNGDGLAESLAGVECDIDVSTGPSPDKDAATEFFTAASRNLYEAGVRAGVRRMVAVSIIGCDRFTGGYNAAKVAHERAACPARSRCACCAPRSSTSSSSSSWRGAQRAMAATCRRCGHSWSPPRPSPRPSPTWLLPGPDATLAGPTFEEWLLAKRR